VKRERDARGDRSMNGYALGQAAALLRRLAFQVNRAAKGGGVEAIHDLRVSCRRLRECLRVFSQFYPAGARRKVRVRLDQVMDLASQVRDRDIALEYIKKASISSDSALRRALVRERDEAVLRLSEELKRWGRQDFSRRWRAKLAL
jgi:CHAD domain-containing protein